MFYVLNYSNQKFIACEYAPEAELRARELMDCGVKPRDIKVIDCSAGGNHTYTVDEFLRRMA